MFAEGDRRLSLADEEDFEILAVIPSDSSKEKDHHSNKDSISPGHDISETCLYHVTATTAVTFIARRYSLAFVLDLSPSLASLDARWMGIDYDKVFPCLCDTLKCLVRPFCIPGSSASNFPQVCISIIAHTPAVNCLAKQMIVHGCLLTSENVDEILEDVRKNLERLETALATAVVSNAAVSDTGQRDNVCIPSPLASPVEAAALATDGRSHASSDHSSSPSKTDDSGGHSVHDKMLITRDVNFFQLVRYGALALQLLPEHSTLGIVLITNGVVALPDAASFELLMQHLRHDTIACSFIQIGSDVSPRGSEPWLGGNGSHWGHIPYTEVLQFIASATFGFYSKSSPAVRSMSPELNPVQHALLTRSFHKPPQSAASSQAGEQLGSHGSTDIDCLDAGFPPVLERPMFHQAIVRKKHSETSLAAPLTAVVACRLREGYCMSGINMIHNESGLHEMEVDLMLPWRDNIHVHYLARSLWPPFNTVKSTDHKRKGSGCAVVTHIQIVTEAPAEFFTKTAQVLSGAAGFKPRGSGSLNDTAARLVRFWQALHSMTQTDVRLVHMHAFNTSPAYYTVPNGLKNGLPLFYPSTASRHGALNQYHQLQNVESVTSDFARYWKAVLMLNINHWKKWLHVHRVSVILEPDNSTGRHLHMRDIATGRYPSVTCKQALDSVTLLVQRMSNFTLLASHTYIRFFFTETDRAVPSWFYILRIDQLLPYLVLRIGFIGGTPGKLRTTILTQLKTSLKQLRFAHRLEGKTNGLIASGSKKLSINRISVASSKSASMERHLSDNPCCFFVRKPLERILVKYDRLPRDFTRYDKYDCVTLNGDGSRMANSVKSVSTNDVITEPLTSTCCLFHQRWLWTVHHGGRTSLSATNGEETIAQQFVVKVLATLTKIRLQEGFHFVSSTSCGVHNMAIELDMQLSTNIVVPCVVQYVIFPPIQSRQRKSSRDSASEDDPVLDSGAAPHGCTDEVEIITECWVECQHGVVVNTTQPLIYLNGLDYLQIPSAIFMVDFNCISSLVTFEHLVIGCQDPRLTLPSTLQQSSALPPSSTSSSSCVQQVEFPFDVFRLLQICQQVELLFSTFTSCGNTMKGGGSNDCSSFPPSTPPPSPNDILFSFILEELRDFNDHEYPMTDADAERLLSHILNRDRDLDFRPFPFPVCPVSPRSPYSSSSYLPITPLPSRYIIYARADGCSAAAPRWRCFLRATSDSRVFVTVIPASYADLCNLNGLPPQSEEGALTVNTANVVEKIVGKRAEPDVAITVRGDDFVSSISSKIDVNLSSYAHPIVRDAAVPATIIDADEQGSSSGQGEVGGEKDVASGQPVDDTVGSTNTKDAVFVAADEVKPKADGGTPLTLPIYVYACTADVVMEALINRCSSGDKPTTDLYEDITFQQDDLNDSYESAHSDDLSADGRGQTPDQPIKRQDRLSNNERRRRGDPSISETDSGESNRERWKTAGRTRGVSGGTTGVEDVYGDDTELKRHCTLISETFLRCFVKGVYASLQLGHDMSAHDVDAAINKICEESMPIEFNISKFIECMCKQTWSRLSDLDLDISARGRISLDHSSSTEENFSCKTTERMNSRVSLKSILDDESHSCETIPGLHLLVQSKFNDILAECFNAIPSNKDYLYYSGPEHRRSHLSDESWTCGDDAQPGDVTSGTRAHSADARSYFFACSDGDTDRRRQFASSGGGGVEGGTGEGRTSTTLITNSSSESILDAVGDRKGGFVGRVNDMGWGSPSEARQRVQRGGEGGEGGGGGRFIRSVKHISPLFSNLVCSVHLPPPEPLGSMQINGLPMCLAKLKSCFSADQRDVSLNDLKVTLDVIFFTLPLVDNCHAAASEEPAAGSGSGGGTLSGSRRMGGGDRPCYLRMTSIGNAVGGGTTDGLTGEDDEDQDPEDFKNLNVNSDSILPSDPIEKLPKHQQHALKSFKKQVSWLLKDEIVSAMLLVMPVTYDMLVTVMNHVRDTPRRDDACFMKSTPLQYVFTAQQSEPLFIKEVEQLRVHRYYIRRLESSALSMSASGAISDSCCLYYLCKDPSSRSLHRQRGRDASKVGARRHTPRDDTAELAPASGTGDKIKEKKHRESSSSHITHDLNFVLHCLAEIDSTLGVGEDKMKVDMVGPPQLSPLNLTPTKGALKRSTAIESLDGERIIGTEVEGHDMEPVMQSTQSVDEHEHMNDIGLAYIPNNENGTIVAVDTSAAVSQEESHDSTNSQIGDARACNTTEFTAMNSKAEQGEEFPKIPKLEQSNVSTEKSQLQSSYIVANVDPNDIRILVSRPSPVREIPVSPSNINSGLNVVSELGGRGMPRTKLKSAENSDEKVETVTVCVASPKTQFTQESNQSHPGTDSNPLDSNSQDCPSSTSHESRSNNAQVGETAKAISLAQTNRSMSDGAVKSGNSNTVPSSLEQYAVAPEGPPRRMRPISGPAFYNAAEHQAMTGVEALKGVISATTVHSMHQMMSSGSMTGSTTRQRSFPALTELTTDNNMYGGITPLRSLHGAVGSSEKFRGSAGTVGGTGSGSGASSKQRSRNASGFETPLSALDTMSIASTGEAGYEGGLSESNDDDDDNEEDDDSINKRDGAIERTGDTGVVQFSSPTNMTDFWFILRPLADQVEIFFHGRDAGPVGEWQKLYREVTTRLSQICRTINQKLLLDNLFVTRECNKLLVPEEDEDVQWMQDKTSVTSSMAAMTAVGRARGLVKNRGLIGLESSDSEEDSEKDGKYLAAAMQFMPGYFACDMIWQTSFVIHPRLKTAKTGNISPAAVHVCGLALQPLVAGLNKFEVKNRRNMFVIQQKDESVFYIRLEEQNFPLSSSADSNDIKLSASLNQPAGLFVSSLRKRPKPPLDGTDVNTADSLSQSMRSGSISLSSKFRTEDRVIMLVHGINPIGSEISNDLVAMLQKRIDEAVLDSIIQTLKRNQQTKLSVEDVQFIQKPGSKPALSLLLLMPASAALHQFAFRYYLQQNLLQIFYPPHYTEGAGTKDEHAFQDYSGTTGSSKVIPRGEAFIFWRPQQAGGKGNGIACIHMSFVDGKGCPVQMLSSPRPSRDAYREPIDRALFDNLISAVPYKPAILPCKSPGPTCLIKFTVWQCGTIDLCNLSDMLQKAVKHAVCDIILEYRLLTAPICEVPPHYIKGMDSPMHSAPASPRLGANNCDYQQDSDYKQVLARRQVFDINRAAIKTPKETSSSMKALLSDAFKPKPPMKSLSQDEQLLVQQQQLQELSSSAATADQEQQLQRMIQNQLSAELSNKIVKYHNGERGTLNPVFLTSLPDLMQYCSSKELSTPSVTTYSYTLLSRFPVDYFLKEVMQHVSQLCGDSPPTLFKSLDPMNGPSDQPPICGPYSVQRSSCKETPVGQSSGSRRSSEVDLVRSCVGGGHSRAYTFVLVARNVAQWRAGLDSCDDDSWSASQQFKLCTASCQKFSALDGSSPESRSPHQSGSAAAMAASAMTKFDQPENVYIPRQRLLLMVIKDKDISLHVYNWTVETCAVLDKHISRLVQWHNARSHLLSGVVHQKMGLFQHLHFSDLKVDKNFKEPNIFVTSNHEIDGLIKGTAPPILQSSHRDRDNTRSRARSGSVAAMSRGGAVGAAHSPLLQPLNTTGSFVTLGPQFDEWFHRARPVAPMQRCLTYATLRDPLHRHGAQAMELRSLEKNVIERNHKLNSLYVSWLNKFPHVSGISPSDFMNVLELLKKISRLIHCVSTPLLFSTQWLVDSHERLAPHTVISTTSKSANVGSSPAVRGNQRSRHSSGSSNRWCSRSESVESKSRFVVASSNVTGSSVVGGPTQAVTAHSSALSDQGMSRGPRGDEPWFVELRKSFLTEYIQYLEKTLGFSTVSQHLQHGTLSSSSSSANVSGFSYQQPPVRVTSSSSTVSRSASTTSTSNMNLSSAPPTYMQKTLKGGIVLIELTVTAVSFAVSVYAFESSRLMLPEGRINSELASAFTDECDRFKDLTHLHSFAHDFHLRVIQSFILGKKNALLSYDFPLTCFLSEIGRFFSTEPSFSWNSLYEGSLMLPTGGSSGRHLFEYMISHETLYGARIINMLPFANNDEDVDNQETKQSALLFDLRDELDRIKQLPSPFSSSSPSSSSLPTKPSASIPHNTPSPIDTSLANFNASLVLTFMAPTSTTYSTQSHLNLPSSAKCLKHSFSTTDSDSLHISLRYWLVLTNKNETTPEARREKKLGVIYSAGIGSSHLRSNVIVPCDADTRHCYHAIGSATSLDKENADHGANQGDSHHSTLHSLIPQLDKFVVSKISKMVCDTRRICFLDLLWQRLLTNELSPSNSTSASGSRERRRSSDVRLKMGADESQGGERKRRRTKEEDGSPLPLLMPLTSHPQLVSLVPPLLTYSEFNDLLALVVRVNHCMADALLCACVKLSASVVQSLISSLVSKYSENHRLFIDKDSPHQYLVIVNPRCPNVFCMLSVDSSADNRIEVSTVYKNETAARQLSSTALDLEQNLVDNVRLCTQSFINTCALYIWSSLVHELH